VCGGEDLKLYKYDYETGIEIGRCLYAHHFASVLRSRCGIILVDPKLLRNAAPAPTATAPNLMFSTSGLPVLKMLQSVTFNYFAFIPVFHSYYL
jgi:hypothetical protein